MPTPLNDYVRAPRAVKRLTLLSLIAVALAWLGTGPLQAASITVTTSKNWSALTGGSGAGGQPNSSDAITVDNSAILTVDTNNAVCGSLQLGISGGGGDGTLSFNAGKVVTCSGS